MYIIDWILFLFLLPSVTYLLFFGIASNFYRQISYPKTNKLRKFAVFFPAYKEDKVIIPTINSFLGQNYPKDLFDIIVISDHMKAETNETLSLLPINLIIARYSESSKAKALALAMSSVSTAEYDIAVIMDADNIVTPNFLTEINKAFDAGIYALQAHRTSKNLNTDIAILDSISEEINNGFFRKGHNAIGFSAGLSGSGMAFDFQWFKQNVYKLQTAGEDKELEALLLKQRVHIAYLNELLVYDEKTQQKDAINNQRKRWIAAQLGALRTSVSDLPKALFSGNFDYCNKIFQWMLPPRLIQLASVFGVTLLVTIISIIISKHGNGDEWTVAIKWWILSFMQIIAIYIPIPKQLLNKSTAKAMLQVPGLVMGAILNLFKLKGAYRKFIHTEHGNH